MTTTTAKIPPQVVEQAAIRLIAKIDHIRALEDDAKIEREFRKRKFFSRRPMYASRTEAIEWLTQCEDPPWFPSQKYWGTYEDANNLWQAAVATTEDMAVSAEDVATLGIESRRKGDVHV